MIEKFSPSVLMGDVTNEMLAEMQALSFEQVKELAEAYPNIHNQNQYLVVELPNVKKAYATWVSIYSYLMRNGNRTDTTQSLRDAGVVFLSGFNYQTYKAQNATQSFIQRKENVVVHQKIIVEDADMPNVAPLVFEEEKKEVVKEKKVKQPKQKK